MRNWGHFYYILHFINNSNEKKVTYISFSAHKRIRKPSKRLIEWTEEYDQIFSTRKKTKKPLQPNGKVKIIQSKICFNFVFLLVCKIQWY